MPKSLKQVSDEIIESNKKELDVNLSSEKAKKDAKEMTDSMSKKIVVNDRGNGTRPWVK